MKTKHLLSWIELSRAALDHNLKSLLRLAGKRRLAICVKANAYGHGLPELVSLLEDRPEIAYLTVHSLDLFSLESFHIEDRLAGPGGRKGKKQYQQEATPHRPAASASASVRKRRCVRIS